MTPYINDKASTQVMKEFLKPTPQGKVLDKTSAKVEQNKNVNLNIRTK